MFASAHVGQSIGGCRNAQDALSLDKLSRRDVKIRVVNCNVARDSGLTSRTADVHVRPPAFGRVEVGQRLKVHRTRNTTGRVGRVCTYLCFGHVTWQWTNAARRQQDVRQDSKLWFQKRQLVTLSQSASSTFPPCTRSAVFHLLTVLRRRETPRNILLKTLADPHSQDRRITNSQSTWHRRRMRPRRWPHRRPTLPPHNCPTNAEALPSMPTLPASEGNTPVCPNLGPPILCARRPSRHRKPFHLPTLAHPQSTQHQSLVAVSLVLLSAERPRRREVAN